MNEGDQITTQANAVLMGCLVVVGWFWSFGTVGFRFCRPSGSRALFTLKNDLKHLGAL